MFCTAGDIIRNVVAIISTMGMFSVHTFFMLSSHDTEHMVKSVQSTLSHLISTSVPCATFTRFFVEHGLFQYYLYLTNWPGVGFHNLMNNLKP